MGWWSLIQNELPEMVLELFLGRSVGRSFVNNELPETTPWLAAEQDQEPPKLP